MSPEAAAGLAGSCLCGEVRYACGAGAKPMGHCHCRTCRKTHASAFSTTLRVPRDGFRWTAGEHLLSYFESSPGKKRFFCSRCGSHLVAAWDHEDEVILRAGALDVDPGVRPAVHIWTSEKAPWYEIEGDLPRLPEGVRRR